jgi:outer membrane protein OmpA-like peptidoglycan-associated protein
VASAPPAWQVHVGEVGVSGGRLHWRDQAPAGGPVALDLEDVRLQLRDAAWPAAARSTSPVLVAATLRPAAAKPRPASSAGDAAPGLSFAGRVGLAPVSWSGQLKVDRLPLQALDPYLADASPVRVLRARLGWKGLLQGEVDDAGLALHLQGDGELADLRARARHPAAAASAAGAAGGAGSAGAEPIPLQAAGAAPAAADGDLLRWQSLSMAGTDVRIAPGRAPAIGVDAVRLAGAYARLVVTEDGHFNLTDLAPSTAASAPGAAASRPETTRAPGGGTTTVAAASAAPAASAPVAGAAASSPQPDIRIGAIAWSDARIEYTDRFVRPNYSAELSAVQGSLGAISTRSPALAPLRLQGRVAGTGTLEVSGQVNPLARPLSLDVRAAASDIELAPLSPYAGKYAGYAIERGKLSMDLHYQVAPDGRLQATNRVVLNQLTFGEKVDSPSATTLPVRLAVALLKDRNGVIDVNLPVGGSINDPQFSIGGLVGRLVVNLLERALTAPFALLSGGGERDLSRVPFVAGTARPDAGADAVLDAVAQALQERPALQLTITGLADDAREHAALQAANLDARLVQMRRAELQRAGGAPAAAALQDAGGLAPADRARLVARLYADTALPDKPRNILGLAKDVPQAEMEARLAAALPLPADAARSLAAQRAQAVRDALAARGLPGERIFMAAPRLQGPDGAARPPDWQPHVLLALTTR